MSMIDRRMFLKLGLLSSGGMMVNPVFAIGSGKKSTDIRICQLKAKTEYYQYRTPLKFGGTASYSITILNVQAEVESRAGRRAIGQGAMSIGNVWSWPSPSLPQSETNTTIVEFGNRLTEFASEKRDYGHPLELTHQLAHHYDTISKKLLSDRNISEPMPKLSQLNAASPLEAALFDAYGKLHGVNIFNLLGKDWVNSDLSEYLNEDFRGEYLDKYTTRTPKKRLPLYHLIGGLDPLTDQDVKKRLNDGVPETLKEWIRADGLSHFKVKLNGNDLESDIARMVQIEKVVAEVEKERKIDFWQYSADFNEKCPNEDYVLNWLEGVRQQSPNARRQLMYIEQPTKRDLRALPTITMHRAAKLCPVVIDESLVSFDSLLLSRERGYSGVALKACKGFSEALLMGAAAQKYGLFLCVQDLTCPGLAFLQSASIASHIPTITAIEGNARQFCPEANEAYRDRFPGLFKITDGTVETAVLDRPGLGF